MQLLAKISGASPGDARLRGVLLAVGAYLIASLLLFLAYTAKLIGLPGLLASIALIAVVNLAFLAAFKLEINERFAEAKDADGKPMGFACDALCYYTNVEGVYIFVPKLHGRVRREADLDRMIHDMVNDSLGLGEGGVLNNDGTTRSAPKSTGLYVPPSARRSSLN